jgi:hypothetical protein
MQDSLLTQNFRSDTSYYDDSGYSRFQLILAPFWRNYLTLPNSSFWKIGAGLNYKFRDGTISDASTIGFAANLTFNVTSTIGIVSGLEIVSYNGKVSGNFNETYSAEDAYGYTFDFSYSLRDYREQQQLVLLLVPLMLKYSMHPFSDVNARLYVAGGFKIGIPVKNLATIKPGFVTTTGYFYEEKNLYSDFPEWGFVNNLTEVVRKSKMGYKVGVTASIEAGIVFMSTEKISAGASIYCDIGLSNILKHNNLHMVEYPQSIYENLHFNSVMNTDHVNSVEIFSIGLKLSITFDVFRKFK